MSNTQFWIVFGVLLSIFFAVCAKRRLSPQDKVHRNMRRGKRETKREEKWKHGREEAGARQEKSQAEAARIRAEREAIEPEALISPATSSNTSLTAPSTSGPKTPTRQSTARVIPMQ
jgi:hypothetical protein